MPDDADLAALEEPATAPTAWLVTGAGGQLGRELVEVLQDRPLDTVAATTRRELDLTDEVGVRRYVDAWLDTAEGAPVVINAAAHTAVDAAETDEAGARLGNVDGPRHLAQSVAGRARLIHVSTDYVFAGDATEPYTPSSPTGPRTVYGRTKLEGEQAVLAVGPAYVVRTAWVYGAHGSNFVRTMAELAGQRDTLQVIDDQVGSPTWTGDLARGLVELGESSAAPGVYHCAGGGQTSWWGLARAVFEELGLDPDRVQPTTSAAFVRPAPRPAYSVLSDGEWAAAGLTPMPDWRDALARAFAESREAFSS